MYIFKGFAPCRRPLMPIAVEVPAWGDLCPQICQKDRRYLLILFGEPHVVALGLFLPLLPLLGERSLVTSTGVCRLTERPMERLSACSPAMGQLGKDYSYSQVCFSGGSFA